MQNDIVKVDDGSNIKPDVVAANFSVEDFVLSKKAGFDPVGICIGTSIYQMAIQVAKKDENVELSQISQGMYDARNNAIGRMRKEAQNQGADGIVGATINIEVIDAATKVMQFTAIGTGVKYNGNDGKVFLTHKGEPFTSNFSVQDLYALVQSGYKPVDLVMGVCVYHVAQRSKLKILMSIGNNLELDSFTQGIYAASKSAQNRMKKEVEKAQANLVLNANVRQGSHDWSSHIIEFFALGTAIKPIAD